MTDDRRAFGERAADATVGAIGTWRFLIVQSALILAWIALNTWLALTGHWDAYPYILLNLMLSLQAAVTAPLILLAGNRQAAKDRQLAQQDYATNLKAEEEITAEALQIAAIAETEARLMAAHQRNAAEIADLRAGFATLKIEVLDHLLAHLPRLLDRPTADAETRNAHRSAPCEGSPPSSSSSC